MSTALDPDELLVAIVLEASPPHTGTAFVEVARRYGDFALVGVAGVVGLAESGAIAHARLVLAEVDATPVRATAAETARIGARPGAAAFAEAASITTGELEPHGDLHASPAYRRHVAGVLVARALERAVQRAAGRA
jgi:carbon-monoxide dehydrogenase medium subunit